MSDSMWLMPAKKPDLYRNFDNGRPMIQQFTCRDDSLRSEFYCSNTISQSSLFPDYTAKLEPGYIFPGNSYDCSSRASGSVESVDMMQRECHKFDPCYLNSPLSQCTNGEEMINLGMHHREAHLRMKTPPEHRFRYRYDTEMSGTHGSLQGMKSGSEKSVPEVELVNFPHEALIRVSLVTCNETGERYPHPHNLFIKEKMYQKKIYENLLNKPLTKTGHYSDPHYIRVGVNGVDYVARFEGMCIISSKKENFSASIKEKLRIRDTEQGTRHVLKEDFPKLVDDAVKFVDLDFVSLCFEAFREEDGRLVPICAPLYSEPIGNAKSANTGKLKISRINKCSGSCKGGDEIWLLVEKINKKGLVIRFFEEVDGKVLWESCIEGDDITLHHQYAIIFKTPPYRDPNISTEVKVFMRLERSSQLSQACNYSEPITFVYEPMKNRNYRNDNLYKKESIISQSKQLPQSLLSPIIKRPRTDNSTVSSITFHYKRRRDEEECATDTCDEDYLNHILSDGDIDSTYFQQFCPDNNFEVSDPWDNLRCFFEVQDDLQKDCISSTIKSPRDLMQIVQYVCSKFDEKEVKKLTDRMNNMQFSKKEKTKTDNGNGNEKKEVEDAVSTLLSLRERAVEINNLKKKVDDCKTLHEAIVKNRPDTVTRLLKTVDYLEQDGDKNTPLHLSLLLRRDSCTEIVLEFCRKMRSDINLKNNEGKTALHLAAANGNVDHVKLLLECGAKVNEMETKTNRTALHIAVLERNKDVAEYLVENTNIKLDALDSDGRTAEAIVQTLKPVEKAMFERIFKPKEVKREQIKDSKPDGKSNNHLNLDKLYEALNETGSWKQLAEFWNCSNIVAAAEKAPNPAKYFFTSVEENQGEFELYELRDLLDAIHEKKGLLVLDEVLARKFL